MKYEMGNNQQNTKDKDKADENMQNNDYIYHFELINSDLVNNNEYSIITNYNN